MKPKVRIKKIPLYYDTHLNLPPPFQFLSIVKIPNIFIQPWTKICLFTAQAKARGIPIHCIHALIHCRRYSIGLLTEMLRCRRCLGKQHLSISHIWGHTLDIIIRPLAFRATSFKHLFVPRAITHNRIDCLPLNWRTLKL